MRNLLSLLIIIAITATSFAQLNTAEEAEFNNLAWQQKEKENALKDQTLRVQKAMQGLSSSAAIMESFRTMSPQERDDAERRYRESPQKYLDGEKYHLNQIETELRSIRARLNVLLQKKLSSPVGATVATQQLEPSQTAPAITQHAQQVQVVPTAHLPLLQETSQTSQPSPAPPSAAKKEEVQPVTSAPTKPEATLAQTEDWLRRNIAGTSCEIQFPKILPTIYEPFLFYDEVKFENNLLIVRGRFKYHIYKRVSGDEVRYDYTDKFTVSLDATKLSPATKQVLWGEEFFIIYTSAVGGVKIERTSEDGITLSIEGATTLKLSCKTWVFPASSETAPRLAKALAHWTSLCGGKEDVF